MHNVSSLISTTFSCKTLLKDENETGGQTTPNIDTPGVVSSINSSEVLLQASNIVQQDEHVEAEMSDEGETYGERVDNGNDTVIMIDPEQDSQPLFEPTTDFEPFPSSYPDSDPEANMQAVGLHWMASEADDLAEDDEFLSQDSQEPMVIPDSSQEDDDVVEVLSTQSSDVQREESADEAQSDDDDVICIDSD